MYAKNELVEMLTPDMVIWAYQNGYFPMAEDDGELFWHAPDPRAVIPLDRVKIARSLRQVLKKAQFDVTFNKDFYGVICGCADRDETWISPEIIEVYADLHAMHLTHSVEVWQDGDLVGGLYGVALGGAFFGESMFSRVSNASKVAFVHLTTHLRKQGFTLLDSQYLNPFTESLGAIEIPFVDYKRQLMEALQLPVRF